jgi:CRISPR-associated protein Cmr6
MPEVLALPQSMVRLAGEVKPDHHPGLRLDKLLPPRSSVSEKFQEWQKRCLGQVLQTAGDQRLLDQLQARRRAVLEKIEAQTWQAKTCGPMTLHLARTSGLENAGICLHPLYGFVYLPGSGLKGLARAYAEMVWKPQHPAEAASIDKVFGQASQDHSASGVIVFHDAWPELWPELCLDIINNHHSGYYDGKDAPGDWEDPVPVYFLAVQAGAAFSFALSKRRHDVPGELLNLARQWLEGALLHLGAGAKTAAGYGSFEPVDAERPALVSASRRSFEATLELVTPAFLGGADPEHEKGTPESEARRQASDLRPAVLRGLLRWWWRTLHAGFVSVVELRQLEAVVWGSTDAGGAVRLTVEPIEKHEPRLYSKAEIKRPPHSLETPSDGIQGIVYHSFGMDDQKKVQGIRRSFQRYYVEARCRWKVVLTVRASWYPVGLPKETARRISADRVLEQAKVALWLLCHFGGVGAKSRKGFGSFDDPKELDASMTLEQCRQLASALRQDCGLSQSFSKEKAGSLSFQEFHEEGLQPLEIPTSWSDPWYALDQIGLAIQEFARQQRGNKSYLGLPRGHLKSRNGKTRHASPIFHHLCRHKDGRLQLRIIAFPARQLQPSLHKELLADLGERLRKRVKDSATKGQWAPPRPTPAAAGPPQRRISSASALSSGGRSQSLLTRVPDSSRVPPTATVSSLPQPGASVDAVLLEQKTSKGGWRARHVGTDIAGPIQNSSAVPPDKRPDDTVKLFVASATPTEIAFRWPTEADLEREKRQSMGGRPTERDRGGQGREPGGPHGGRGSGPGRRR